MADPYDYWRRTVAKEVVDVVAGEPQAGFYAWRAAKGEEPVAVAIWPDGSGGMAGCTDLGGPFDPYAAWGEVKFTAVPEAWFRAREKGEPWPDAPPEPPDERRTWNLPADDYEALKLQIEGEALDIRAFLKEPILPGDKDRADQAANWAHRVAETTDKAEELRVAEKKPHDEAAKKVQQKWKPLVDLGDDVKRALKAALIPYLRAEEDERRAREAEARALDTPPPRMERGGAGRTGSKVSLRKSWVAEIEDYQACLAFFAEHDDVKALVQKLADKVARAGADVPGCKRVEVETAQ